MNKGEEKKLITVCEGMSHERSKNPFDVCHDVIVANNTYREKR